MASTRAKARKLGSFFDARDIDKISPRAAINRQKVKDQLQALDDFDYFDEDDGYEAGVLYTADDADYSEEERRSDDDTKANSLMDSQVVDLDPEPPMTEEENEKLASELMDLQDQIDMHLEAHVDIFNNESDIDPKHMISENESEDFIAELIDQAAILKDKLKSSYASSRLFPKHDGAVSSGEESLILDSQLRPNTFI